MIDSKMAGNLMGVQPEEDHIQPRAETHAIEGYTKRLSETRSRSKGKSFESIFFRLK